jgi:hypothetical protein
MPNKINGVQRKITNDFFWVLERNVGMALNSTMVEKNQ